MTVLITGAAGFIASHITDALINQNAKVIIIDNLSSGKQENINPKATFYKININNPKLNSIFKKEKPDIVCHHAAQMNVRHSVENPVFDAEQNIIGSIKLLEAVKKYNTKKIIFASTGGAIYGEQNYFPANEQHPLNPVSPYGISKLTIEKYLYFYYKQYNIPYLALRYANVYGPRQNHLSEAGVVAIFISKILNNQQTFIFGDGTQTRDYVYIDDVVKYNLNAIKNNAIGVFNVGTAKETSVNTLFNIIKNKINKQIYPKYAKAQPGEQKRSSISPLKAIKNLNYKPKIDLDIGIENTIKYFREKYKQG